MAREKKCKDCGIDFVGFTPVCKECNSKKGQEIAEENKNKTRNMPGALSAVPRRSQKTAENAEAPTTNAPEPEKKNLFNQNNNNNNNSSNNNNYNNYNNNNFNFKNMNNNNVPYNNNVPDFRNNNQTSNQFYSQNNVFGNGFNRKKKTEGGGNANPGEHQNNQNEHMASLFSRNRNYQNGNQNRNGEEKQTYQTLKAFDFKNNKNQAGGRGLGDRNVFKEEVKEEEVLNPFTHLKKVCESFKDGACKYGQKCTYFHPTEEDVISKDVKPKKVDRSNISKDRFGTKL